MQPTNTTGKQAIKEGVTPLTISSLTLTGPASAGTTEPAHPAKTPPDKPPTVIRRGLTLGRERLAGTVKAVTHKVPVPGRRKDTVREAKDTVREAKDTLRATVEHGKQLLQHGSKTAQDKASAATRQANKVTHQALAKVPAPVVGRFERLRGTVRHRPVPAVAAVLGVVLMLRLLLRRNQ